MVWASRSSLTTLCRRLTRKARRAAERRFFSPCGLQYKTSNIKLLHITLPPLFASVCVCTYVSIHLTHTHAFSITHTQSLRARAISLSLLSLSVCLYSTPAPSSLSQTPAGLESITGSEELLDHHVVRLNTLRDDRGKRHVEHCLQVYPHVRNLRLGCRV